MTKNSGGCAAKLATTAKYFYKLALTLVGMKYPSAFLKEKIAIEELNNEFKQSDC